MIKFIRTTHENGRCRSFPPAAWQFWREQGAIVGKLLRIESPLTFAEIVAASQEYALEYPESGLCQAMDETYIAWCLVKLLGYGMADIVNVEVVYEATEHQERR